MNCTRRAFLGSTAAPLLAPALRAQKGPASARSNLVLIVAEDLAAWMLGCYGNVEIKTPHIDHLASTGTRFLDHFLCTPASSASRATLLTGRLPRQHGIADYLTSAPRQDPERGQSAPPPSFASEVLLSDLLSTAGYRCAFVGRWDLGGDERPGHGFSETATLPAPAVSTGPSLFLNGQSSSESGPTPAVLTRHASAFLDRQSSSPFFLVVSYPAAGPCYDALAPKYADLYKNASFQTLGTQPASASALEGKQMLADPLGSIRRAAAAISALDEQVGALQDSLYRHGLLNVSRELLQGSRVVDNIRSNATKKVLRLLADTAEKEPEKYATFWKEFGAVLKEGLAEDYGNRDEIARLLRFTSTRSSSDEPDVSLAGYVSRMKEGQQHIYYLLAPGLAAAKASPHLEAFRKKGIEVLLLGDGEGIDNWVVASLRDFDGKRLQSVAQGSGDLSELEDEAEAAAKEQASAEFAGLVGQLKAALDGRAFDVRVSSRLTTSPACIVANEADIDINLARRLRGSGLPSQPVLEINPDHPLVRRLNHEPADPHLAEWAHVLFDQAVLTLGARIEEPAAFVNRLNDLLINLASPEDPANPEP